MFDHLVDETCDFDPHLLERRRLLVVLSRVHKRCELDIDLQVTFVGLSRFWADNFERALRHNFSLAESEEDLAVLLTKFDLVDLPGSISPVVFELGMADQSGLLDGAGIGPTVQVDRLDQEILLVFGQWLEHIWRQLYRF